MMDHEKTDQDILFDVRAVIDNMSVVDYLRTEWQQYRALQLLEWLSDNIERIKRESQGSVIEHRVPDRLPQDSSLWTQETLP